jgi:hypothetical protein
VLDQSPEVAFMTAALKRLKPAERDAIIAYYVNCAPASELETKWGFPPDGSVSCGILCGTSSSGSRIAWRVTAPDSGKRRGGVRGANPGNKPIKNGTRYS